MTGPQSFLTLCLSRVQTVAAHQNHLDRVLKIFQHRFHHGFVKDPQMLLKCSKVENVCSGGFTSGCCPSFPLLSTLKLLPHAILGLLYSLGAPVISVSGPMTSISACILVSATYLSLHPAGMTSFSPVHFFLQMAPQQSYLYTHSNSFKFTTHYSGKTGGSQQRGNAVLPTPNFTNYISPQNASMAEGGWFGRAILSSQGPQKDTDPQIRGTPSHLQEFPS